jgi:thymidylate synthase
MLNNVYHNAQEAFEDLYRILNNVRTHENGTRKIYNVGIKLLYPMENKIKTPERAWSISYAEREWDWYMSENRSVEELKKYAPIWNKMHNGDNIVNSNYGYLWNENSQLDKIVEKLRKDPLTRQAWLTIYDGKNIDKFKFDTPCTLSIGFYIDEGVLCMTVLMRSNDLWYGFCNDQYCFSRLHEIVAARLNRNMGAYYHYAADMHLYKQHFEKM